MVFKSLQDFLDYLDLSNFNRIPNISPTDPFAITSVILLILLPFIALIVVRVVIRRTVETLEDGILLERQYRRLRRMPRTAKLIRDVRTAWDECGRLIEPPPPTTPASLTSLLFPPTVPARKPLPMAHNPARSTSVLSPPTVPARKPLPISRMAHNPAPILKTHESTRFEQLPSTSRLDTPLLTRADSSMENQEDTAMDFIEVYDRYLEEHRAPTIEIELDRTPVDWGMFKTSENLQVSPLQVKNQIMRK